MNRTIADVIEDLITEKQGKVVKGLGGLYEVRIEENGKDWKEEADNGI